MEKVCKKCEKSFTVTPDDAAFYEKIGVSTPTLCPECRYIRRLLDRNEYNFYKRKCSATGKDIISIYRPDAPFPVYQQDYWKSDAWDATSYGRDYDFNRPFFEQYEELRRATPHLAMVNSNSVNSEYTNQANNNKDCYMLLTSDRSEKCMYGSWNHGGVFMCSDCYMVEKSEFCYQSVDVANCSSSGWLNDCSHCVNVFFASMCRACTDCFGCVGLRNKQYCWANEQLTKEEYEKRIKEFGWTNEAIARAKDDLAKLRLSIPVKYYHGSRIENSSGDYLEDAQRTRMAFNSRVNKDVAYMQDAWRDEDCRDCTEIINGEQAYEIQGTETPHGTIVARSCFSTITDSAYCDMCFGANNCFGCFGLRQKQYCILNKQYSKEEYLSLKEKIVAQMKAAREWGEYFPPEVSPFAYNESMAQDYFPLTRDEARAKGYSWYEKPEAKYNITLNSRDLPKTISETDDTAILAATIQCKTQESEASKLANLSCTTAFRLVPLELTLYRKLGIPVPEYCWACRRTERFKARNPRRLHAETCQCSGTEGRNSGSGAAYINTASHFHGKDAACPNSFETSYIEGHPEIVYCEQCYSAEMA